MTSAKLEERVSRLEAEVLKNRQALVKMSDLVTHLYRINNTIIEALKVQDGHILPDGESPDS